MNRFEAIECVYRCCEDRKKNSLCMRCSVSRGTNRMRCGNDVKKSATDSLSQRAGVVQDAMLGR
jgi:hypothetical protein